MPSKRQLEQWCQETVLLRKAIGLMLDKLQEHNPETGYHFAVEHGLTPYLTMLMVAHASVTLPELREKAWQHIRAMEAASGQTTPDIPD